MTYASAKRAYTESSVLTATPEQLVVMLYDGAIRFLNQAAAATEAGNREVAINRIRRADAIIDELNLSLDMSYGDVPQRLRSIYLFCKRQLREAIFERSSEPLLVTAKLLGELRESWEQIAREAAATRAPVAATA